jgi:hypothetical protein
MDAVNIEDLRTGRRRRGGCSAGMPDVIRIERGERTGQAA